MLRRELPPALCVDDIEVGDYLVDAFSYFKRNGVDRVEGITHFGSYEADKLFQVNVVDVVDKKKGAYVGRYNYCGAAKLDSSILIKGPNSKTPYRTILGKELMAFIEEDSSERRE